METKQTQLLITQKQLSVRWQVCAWTIWDWCRRKKMPDAFVLPSGRRRWFLSDIEKFEKTNLRSAGEFNPVYCRRGENAASARKRESRQKFKTGCENSKKRGRPRKSVQVEKRRGTQQ
ncbi:helix-turn-helix transcriptional regulator [Mariprofundus micogutta]|uniref:helix-turn-helix transcriptional regulator n=1 Tax=Mariprofundus micogutta TaxID=1921010 RepID=UPI001160680A|nr:hypothetical protein [Mariprofundus micogutta]